MPRQRVPLAQMDPNVQRSLESEKPGPKPKSFEERSIRYKEPKAVQRHMGFVSRETKIKVILYIYNKKIEDKSHLNGGQAKHQREGLQYYERPWRGPTNEEVAKHFKRPVSTINRWWQDRYNILYSTKGCRVNRKHVMREVWPALEEQLHGELYKKRLLKRPVSQGWLRRRAKKIFQELYPHVASSNRQVNLNASTPINIINPNQ